jgi:hypothetical protein
MKSVCLALLLATPMMLLAKQKEPAQYKIPIPPPPDFSSLSWLIGDWTGHTTAKSPQGDLHFSAAYDVGKRVIVLRGSLSLDATQTTSVQDESWMGILSPGPSPSTFNLEVYSSTGFVSRFQVTSDGDTINVEPAGGQSPPPGMLFRRTLQRTEDGGFSETVQVAPATRPFFDYYTAKFSRETPAKIPEVPAQAPANPAQTPVSSPPANSDKTPAQPQ